VDASRASLVSVAKFVDFREDVKVMPMNRA
jgi:hypothetical protein